MRATRWRGGRGGLLILTWLALLSGVAAGTAREARAKDCVAYYCWTEPADPGAIRRCRVEAKNGPDASWDMLACPDDAHQPRIERCVPAVEHTAGVSPNLPYGSSIFWLEGVQYQTDARPSSRCRAHTYDIWLPGARGDWEDIRQQELSGTRRR
ncbi:MAG: hypothetical protein H6744_00160 [Deltaproteobacteria bacterium]|nr:hypothetical protein [Deltaproteobacteria bacterium]